MNHKTDILIIGAGMAGLSVAVELKRLGYRYAILEAQAEVGGRAASLNTATGLAVDLGAHWFHGKHNPLKRVLDHYGLTYNRDRASQMRIYHKGRMHKVKGSEWLDSFIDSKKAKEVEKGEASDRTIPALAKNAKGHANLKAFVRMWDGLTPPLLPSAHEFLTDESTPGGLQLPQGMGMLFEHLKKDAGTRRIHVNEGASSIADHGNHVEVITSRAVRWQARNVLFTGSLGVIQSGAVTFDPPLTKGFKDDLALISMGKMNKIIVELEPTFFRERKIPANLSLELLGRPPHFCHVRSAGNPLISLFISGPRAEEIEAYSSEEALDYLCRRLAPVKDLAGFESYVIGKPMITAWVSNPYIRGSYSACLPGGRRTGPRKHGNIYFAGDTFDEHYPSALAGAYLSGRTAAKLIVSAHKA